MEKAAGRGKEISVARFVILVGVFVLLNLVLGMVSKLVLGLVWRFGSILNSSAGTILAGIALGPVAALVTGLISWSVTLAEYVTLPHYVTGFGGLVGRTIPELAQQSSVAIAAAFLSTKGQFAPWCRMIFALIAVGLVGSAAYVVAAIVLITPGLFSFFLLPAIVGFYSFVSGLVAGLAWYAFSSKLLPGGLKDISVPDDKASPWFRISPLRWGVLFSGAVLLVPATLLALPQVLPLDMPLESMRAFGQWAFNTVFVLEVVASAIAYVIVCALVRKWPLVILLLALVPIILSVDLMLVLSAAARMGNYL